MSPELLAAIRERVEKAGPWALHADYYQPTTDVVALLAEVDRLRALLPPESP